jgi:GAF domain-containing protein
MIGLAVALVGPVLVTPLSVHYLERLPGIPYYLVVALAARLGRLVAGAVATVVSAILLVAYVFTPGDALGVHGSEVVSLISFLAISTLLATAVSVERAAEGRAALARDRLRLLADVTRIVEAGLDSHVALQQLAEHVTPGLADWCAIHTLEEGQLVLAAVAHPDPEKVALATRLLAEYPATLDDAGVGQVVRSGTHQFIPDVTEDMIREAARDPEHLAVIRGVGIRSVIIAPLTARGRTLGALTLIIAEGARRYDQEDVAFVLELAARTSSIVYAVQAYEQERAALRRNELVQGFAEALSKAVTVEEVLEVVVNDAISVLTASRSLIALVDEDRRHLRIVANSGYGEGVRSRWKAFPLDATLPMSEAVREHRVVIVGDRTERDARYPALANEPMDNHTLVCLPLIAEGEEIGGVSLSYPAVRIVSTEEIPFLMAIGSLAAQALRRALLFEERDRTARALQATLLPRELPEIAGVRFAAGYWPAGRGSEVGGDFYDVIPTDDGFLALVGDVCGRGPEAAAIMGIARNTVRVLAEREPSLRSMFGAINDALRVETAEEGSTFVTLCGVAARRSAGGSLTVEVLCAGHPHPVLVGRGAARSIGVSNLPLGLFPTAPMELVRETLTPGETLILYTDGLAERDRDHVPVETDPTWTRVLGQIDSEGPDVFVREVEEVLARASGTSDDVAVLLLRVEPDTGAGAALTGHVAERPAALGRRDPH